MSSALKTIHTEFKRSSYFKRVFFSYLLISFILLFSFTYIVVVSSDSYYKDNLYALSQNNLKTYQTVNEGILTDLYSYCLTNVMQDGHALALMYSDSFNEENALYAYHLLPKLMQLSHAVTSVYFINFNTKTVLTNISRCRFEQFSDQGMLEYLGGISPGKYPLLFLPRTARIRGQDMPVWSLVFYHSAKGALAVNLDAAGYADIVDVSSQISSIQTMILNKYGQILSSTNPALFGSDYTDDPVYSRVMKSQNTYGSFLYTENGSRWRVHYRKGENLGFCYIITTKLSFIDMENDLLPKIFLIFAAIMLFSLAVSVFMSIRMYRPVRELRQELDSYALPAVLEYTGPKDIRDDFAQFTSIYKEMASKNRQLHFNMRNYKKDTESLLLRQLIEPQDYSRRFETRDYEELLACFSKLHYMVCLICIDEAQDEGSTLNYGLVKFAIRNVFGELCEHECLLKCMDYSPKMVACILNSDVFIRDTQKNTALQLSDFIQQLFHVRLTTAYSTQVMDTDDLPLALSEAKKALARRLLDASARVLFYEDIRNTEHAQQPYPYKAEQQILAALKNAARDTAKKELDCFFEILKSYSYHSFLLYVLQLNAGIDRFEYAAGLQPGGSPDDLTDIQSLTMDDMHRLLMERCCRDCDMLSEIRQHMDDKSSLIETVNRLVEENLYQPNLSVAFLADEVHLSVNYLRNIYKEKQGVSLSGYIIQKKLDRAMELLSESQLSITQISEKLGFSSKNYFFTFFKKHTGKTPSQYRKE